MKKRSSKPGMGREKRAALAAKVAAMTQEEREQIVSEAVGLVTIEGHPLSMRNTLLVAMQVPGATVVGGFHQWLDAGRCVKKGEHGAQILVPSGKGEVEEEIDENGKKSSIRFLFGYVFDVTQTEPVEVTATEPEPAESF